MIRGSQALVAFLLDRGADPHRPALRGDVPLVCAIREHQRDVALLLLKSAAGRGVTAALEAAAQEGSLEILGALLETVPGPLHLGAALMAGCRGLQAESVALLLKHGADPNARTYSENTALMQATRAGAIGCVEVLLAGGADPAATNQDGHTALMLAAASAAPTLVDLLLRAGSPLEIFDKTWGYTALTIARMQKEPRADEVVALLEAAGAAERPFRRPPPGELLPRDECEVCVYLPWEGRYELEKTRRPIEALPNLVVLSEKTWGEGRYVDVTQALPPLPRLRRPLRVSSRVRRRGRMGLPTLH